MAICFKRIGNTVIELRHDKQHPEIVSEFLGILSPLPIEPYIHTHRVVLSPSMPSHSHPMLTIHETHVTSELLPAVFVHEQMHWRLTQSQKTPAILGSLTRAFMKRPDLDPVHLAVCQLEVRALTTLFGRDAVRRIVDRRAGIQASIKLLCSIVMSSKPVLTASVQKRPARPAFPQAKDSSKIDAAAIQLPNRSLVEPAESD